MLALNAPQKTVFGRKSDTHTAQDSTTSDQKQTMHGGNGSEHCNQA